jgi:hypothetical protein
MHKNRLQEYTQRSGIPLPIYQTINEGSSHAPQFRSSVLIDGVSYTSPNTFSHRKAAEQDVAKLALEGISLKIKEEGCPLILEVCCGVNVDLDLGCLVIPFFDQIVIFFSSIFCMLSSLS